jgi:hypothetical protein
MVLFVKCAKYSSLTLQDLVLHHLQSSWETPLHTLGAPHELTLAHIQKLLGSRQVSPKTQLPGYPQYPILQPDNLPIIPRTKTQKMNHHKTKKKQTKSPRQASREPEHTLLRRLRTEHCSVRLPSRTIKRLQPNINHVGMARKARTAQKAGSYSTKTKS